MPADTDTKIIKTCPSCSDTNQSLIRPNVEAQMGSKWYYAKYFPLYTKIHRGGLPTEIKHKCTNCQAESTWDLVQTDLESLDIDYTLHVE